MRFSILLTLRHKRLAPSAVIVGALVILVVAISACTPRASSGSSSSVPTQAAASPCAMASPSSATQGPAPDSTTPPTDDLTPLSDEFNGAPGLGSWTNLSTVEGWPSQIDKLDVNTTSPGNLYLVPFTSTWFDDYHGVFLYRELTGDFMVTARVKATGKHSAVPTSAFSLAGVMVRAPRTITPQTWTPGHENWVFITTGIGDPGQSKPQIETKTTVNSHSVLRLIPSQADWVELRIARVGRAFVMLYRFSDSAWTLSQCYDRQDMPQTLQVGLNAYTDWGTIDARFQGHEGDFNRTLLTGADTYPDLIEQCDYAHFRRPPLPDNLRARIAAGTVSLDTWLPYVMR